MTDHPANDQFHASSFMQGHNAEYLEQLYAQYANDPDAVDAAWAEFFRQMGDAELDVKADAKGPSWARSDWPPVPNDDLTLALTGDYPPAAAETKAAGSKIAKKSGWGFQTRNNRGKLLVTDWNETGHLMAIVGRLKHAFIENDDALSIIARYDGPRALFYCDPPYLQDLRRPQSYRCEIDEEYHCRLLERLQAIQGMAIISGYPSDLYNEYLRDWQRFEMTARTTNALNTVKEIIWVSPAATARGQGMLW